VGLLVRADPDRPQRAAAVHAGGAALLLAALPAVLFVKPPDMPWKGVAAYGAVIGVFQFRIAVRRHQARDAGRPVVARGSQLQAFFTIALAVAFRRRPLRPLETRSAPDIATAGIVVLGWHKVEAGDAATLAGFILVVAAAFAMGARAT
jgi:O-acetylserine/cysteine efflux transporter